MTVLYVTEYQAESPYDMPYEPTNLAEQHVAMSGTSAQSSAFQTGTQFVRLVSDVDCWIAFGTNPTAVNTAHYLPAKTIVYSGVQAGASWKVAAVSS